MPLFFKRAELWIIYVSGCAHPWPDCKDLYKEVLSLEDSNFMLAKAQWKASVHEWVSQQTLAPQSRLVRSFNCLSIGKGTANNRQIRSPASVGTVVDEATSSKVSTVQLGVPHVRNAISRIFSKFYI
jgi:hypothetical protein